MHITSRSGKRIDPAILLALLLLLNFPTRAVGEQTPAQKLLGRRIIGPSVALEEVRLFTESRVPAMPEVKSVLQWEEHAARIRHDVLQRVVFRGAAARWRQEKTKVQWLDTIAGGPGYRIKKLRYQAVPGLWVPALLYEPEKLSGRVPVVMNVNGHIGTGKATPYKQIRCINQAKRGMIALNVEWLGMGQLATRNFQHYRMNQLDLCGTSGLAPFYLAMQRGLDILLDHKHADPQRVAVAGLSGGGWQTIIISSLDTRVTLANPVAGYSSFRTRARHASDLGDSEQTPVDLAMVADYTHLTALLAPRAALLTYNVKDDCCFAAGHALPPLLEAARPIYKLYGKQDRLRSHVNHDPGTHNFERDNRQALYRMLGDFFFDSVADYRGEEIDSQAEVKTAKQLHVELPSENADFHTLALALSKNLPREAGLPDNKPDALRWRNERAAELAKIVRAKPYSLAAHRESTDQHQNVQAAYWKLRIGDAWTVPAVELSRGNPQATTIVVADGGYASAALAVDRLLDQGQRVLAVDPFYFGQSKIAERDFLYGLLVSSVGQRPLGIQARQLAAVARWLDTHRQAGPVTLLAIGPRGSLFSLVAAGLERKAISSVELHGSFGSLKQVIEENRAVNTAPELFTFGLLEKFDIRQLIALTAPRQVVLINPTDRAKTELAPLKDWYTLLGNPHDPLAAP